MVVVGDLVSFVDDLFSVNDNFLAVTDGKDLCCTIWRAAVIDETSEIAFHGSIDNHIIVHSAENMIVSGTHSDQHGQIKSLQKITRTNALTFIGLLSLVCHLLTNLLANIFDDHLARWNMFQGV